VRAQGQPRANGGQRKHHQRDRCPRELARAGFGRIQPGQGIGRGAAAGGIQAPLGLGQRADHGGSTQLAALEHGADVGCRRVGMPFDRVAIGAEHDHGQLWMARGKPLRQRVRLRHRAGVEQQERRGEAGALERLRVFDKVRAEAVAERRPDFDQQCVIARQHPGFASPCRLRSAAWPCLAGLLAGPSCAGHCAGPLA